MTAVYHVPRNNRLADTDPLADDARDAWARYLAEWTRWNHFRALSSLGAAAALTIAVSLG